jgi:hypothetical protein
MKKLKLGSKVLYNNKVCTILGFNYNLETCVVEGVPNGHKGGDSDYWHDEKGNKIPYVEGNGRWYIRISSLEPIETQEPEFIFNI